MESPYEVLHIDPDATPTEIERAYRERIKQAHPDQGGTPEEFQRVREAYEELKSGAWEPDAEAFDDLDVETPENGREPVTESRVEYLDYSVLVDHGWDIDDPDLFEKASEADLSPGEYGRFLVEPDETLLEAAESRGFTWPYSCRGGACANCAVAIRDGELSQPADHILPGGMIDRGIRLSCLGKPTTDRLQVVYNVKYLPELDELRLPPHPFESAHRNR